MTAQASILQGGAGVPLPRADTQVVRAIVYGTLASLDFAVILAAFALSDLFRHESLTDLMSASYLMILPVFLAVSFYSRAYTYATVISSRRSIGTAASSMLVSVAVTIVLIFALKNSGDVSRIAFFSGALFSLAGLVAVRLALARFIRRLGSRFFRRLLIVEGDFGEPVPAGFERISVDLFGIRPEVADPLMLHRFSQLVAGADRVVVSCPVAHRERWSLYLKSVDCDGEILVPELRDIEPLIHEHGTGLTGVRVSVGRLDIRNRLLKRGFDLAITVPALVVLLPLMTLVAIAIKLESRGPILFKQQRMGRANQLFDVLKFRSMYVERGDAVGDRSTARDDDRITPLGRLIRRTSIDELPQLFNVINGDMSLVGPRPHALGSRAGDELFWLVDHRYWLRHTIKPGLTGLAQVRGHRGATEHVTDLKKRLESDIEYLSHWSLANDFVILVRTLFVLMHRNAY